MDTIGKLRDLASDVRHRGVPGDFVECGVCDGWSAAPLASTFVGSGRRFWLYDSFEGLPPTTEEDGEEAKEWIGKCLGSRDKVEAAISEVGFPLDDCIFRVGWFEDTFVEPLPASVAFLHIDADWYKSVLIALETFYDRVAEGGIILLDDFGYWEGCRRAVFDFVKRRNIAPLLERYGHSQLYWVKGREHNRDAAHGKRRAI